MDSLSNEELGDLGEDVVREWARRAGMERSTPDKDRKGWDLFLEFRLRDEEVQNSDKPLDKDSREVKALIQVKTTSRTPGQRRIKLSNLVSLVEHGGPSYIVVLEMDSRYPDAEVETAYVVHVGRDIIADVLKKKRELENKRLQAEADGEDPEPIQLHKHRIPVVYEDFPLHEPSYRVFREALVDPLEGDPQQYLEWKRRVYKTVGYSETGMATAVGRFSIQLPEEYQGSPEDYFADSAFGKVAPMEVTGGEMRDLRFNIPSNSTPIPESSLKVDSPTQEVKIKFERQGLGNRLKTDGEIQIVMLPSSDGEKYMAANLSVARAELIYRDRGDLTEVNFGFDIEPGNYYLDELWETARLASFLREAGENEEDVQIEIKYLTTGEWEPLPTLKMSESVSLKDLQTDGVRLFTSATEHARQLADDLQMHDQLEVSIEQLYTYRTVLRIYSELRHVQEGQSTGEGVFMGFDKNSEVPEEIRRENSEVCFIDLMSLELGQQLIVVSFGLSGQLSSLDISEKDTPDERERKRSAAAQLPESVEGYELSIENVFYLQPYYFERGENTPARKVFLEGAFEKATDNCQYVLSLIEAGELVMYVME